MSSTRENDPLPDPPGGLSHGEVELCLGRIVPGDPVFDYVPYYHFRILNAGGQDVGHLNFRVGDTALVRMYLGHVGFGVSPEHRGHGYARQACLAAAPCIRLFHPTVVLTCDPENMVSRRTLERLGATFIEEVAVPPDQAPHVRGARAKRRYHWTP